MFESVERHYPLIRPILDPFVQDLVKTPFEEIEEQCGYDMLQVNLAGLDDPRYMTPSRLRAIEDHQLYQARAWLYDTVGCGRLFDGSGLTKDHLGGELMMCEYFVPNMKLKDIPHVLIPLDDIVLESLEEKND